MENTKNKKRAEKAPIYDDGRTIVNMNVEGMPWYNPTYTGKVEKKDKPSFKEKWAMIKGAYLAFLPFVLCTVGGFAVIMLLMSIWFH